MPSVGNSVTRYLSKFIMQSQHLAETVSPHLLILLLTVFRCTLVALDCISSWVHTFRCSAFLATKGSVTAHFYSRRVSLRIALSSFQPNPGTSLQPKIGSFILIIQPQNRSDVG